MKKLILIMLVFSPHFFTAAQVEFAPVGAKWTVNYHSFLNCNIYPQYFLPKVLECTGTEMIQGQLCKKLEGDFACSFFTDPLVVIYIYQEEGKVFVYNPNTSDFHILYNFDADVGESWTVSGLPYFSSPGYDEIIVTVTAVENITLNGDILKKQTVEFYIPTEPNYQPGWSTTFIEKVGNTNQMFPQHPLCDAPYLSLRCYEDDDNTYLFDSPAGLCGVEIAIEPGYACGDTITILLNSSDDISNKNAIIFPNPASSEVHITLPGVAACHYEIMNVTGRILKNGILIEEQNDVNIAGLAAGVYFIILKNVRQEAHCEKLVVVR